MSDPAQNAKLNALSVFKSGIPAAATSAILFAGVARQPSPTNHIFRPTRLSCAGFGAAHALGAWMIYDQDPKNGAGFLSIWGWLYLMVNGKNLLRQPGLYPKVASLAVTSSAIGYSALFLYLPSATPPQSFGAPQPPAQPSGPMQPQ